MERSRTGRGGAERQARIAIEAVAFAGDLSDTARLNALRRLGEVVETCAVEIATRRIAPPNKRSDMIGKVVPRRAGKRPTRQPS